MELSKRLVRERVFHQDIQTPISGLKKRGAAEFFNRLQGFWIPDKALFGAFDMASQAFIILGEKLKPKVSQNFMLVKVWYPNHRHGSDFLCFLSMNY